MSTATTTANWRRMPPVPRPLQRLFDSVPLLTYEPNELPARAQSSTSSQIPTLYIFSSEEDSRHGAPSFNPGCLKWQTFFKLLKLEFNILPSTNHASPTGSLPFLLPARDASSPTTTPAKPIPTSKLYDYALSHSSRSSSAFTSPESLRQDAYQSLIDVSIRNAFLYTLYLDPRRSALLDRLYIRPSTSSTWIQATLRHQLRRAAETEILKTTHAISGGGGGVHGVVNHEEVLRRAKEALEALAGELRAGNSESGWFFGAAEPGLFDASVFAYTYLMTGLFANEANPGEIGPGEEEVGPGLGDLVIQAGSGELISHMNRVLALTWPDLVQGSG